MGIRSGGLRYAPTPPADVPPLRRLFGATLGSVRPAKPLGRRHGHKQPRKTAALPARRHLFTCRVAEHCPGVTVMPCRRPLQPDRLQQLRSPDAERSRVICPSWQRLKARPTWSEFFAPWLAHSNSHFPRAIDLSRQTLPTTRRRRLRSIQSSKALLYGDEIVPAVTFFIGKQKSNYADNQIRVVEWSSL